MTTGKGISASRPIEDTIDFKSVFEFMPGCSVLLATDAPKFTILAATIDYLLTSQKKMEDVIGKSLFEALPANSDDKDLQAVII